MAPQRAVETEERDQCHRLLAEDALTDRRIGVVGHLERCWWRWLFGNTLDRRIVTEHQAEAREAVEDSERFGERDDLREREVLLQSGAHGVVDAMGIDHELLREGERGRLGIRVAVRSRPLAQSLDLLVA